MKNYAEEFGDGGLNRQLDVDALVEACGLDSREIRWRKEFVGFDETDEERLDGMAPLFREHAD